MEMVSSKLARVRYWRIGEPLDGELMLKQIETATRVSYLVKFFMHGEQMCVCQS
jgi:hypothetical protein